MQAAGVVDLALLVICGFLIALAFAYRVTIAAALVWTAEQLRKVSINTHIFGTVRPLDWLADVLESVNNAVLHYLGVAISNTSHAWKTLWHYQAYAWHKLTEALEGATQDTFTTIHGIIHHTIPHAIQAAIASLLTRVAALEGRAASVVHEVTRTVVHEVTRVEKVTVHKAVVISHTVAIPRIGPLERDVADLERKVRELARRSTGAIAAGVVGYALAQLGASWARCSKANRAGRQLCAMDEDLLGALLGGALLLVSAFSLRELATGTLDAMDLLSSGVTGSIRELKGTTPTAFTGYTGHVDGRT